MAIIMQKTMPFYAYDPQVSQSNRVRTSFSRGTAFGDLRICLIYFRQIISMRRRLITISIA